MEEGGDTEAAEAEIRQQVQALAIQISENALAHRICGQRNPRSVAGASIYLASHLEDQGTTQTEISKVRLP